MDNREKYLVTKTNPTKSMMAAGIPSGVIGGLLLICFAGSGLWKAGLYFGGIVLLTGAISIWIISKNVWKVVFRNSTVTATCRSYYYHLDTAKAYDFTFKQTPSQKAKNRGDIWIKGLDFKGRNFPLADVENFSEVKKYVEENF